MRDTSGMSPMAADAIKNIRNQDTGFQRRRAMRHKVIGAGVNAGLMGIQGVVKGIESQGLQERQEAAERKRVTDEAIRNAKRPPMQPPSGGPTTDEYGLKPVNSYSDGSPNYSQAMDNAVRHGTPYTPAAAKASLAQIDANEAATQAPIAGHWTDEGFKNSDMMAAVNGSDINRAKGAMQFGGLMNSHISDGLSDDPYPMPDVSLNEPEIGRRR